MTCPCGREPDPGVCHCEGPRNSHCACAHSREHPPLPTPNQQAMWEALAILGFDTDGDQTPGACIAGMGAAGFRRLFLDHMRELRRDYDELLDELPDGADA